MIQYAKFNFGEYETVDLCGRTVLPGLIDGHTHPSMIAKATWVIYGPDTYDREELYQNIREAARKYPKEVRPYFVYSCYHFETFGEAGPRREVLDELIPDRPARINDDTGHGCWYNSMALEMLKDENGIPHSITPIFGQTFFKDEKGEYTKLVYVAVGNRLIPMVSSHGRYERREYEYIALPEELRSGITVNADINGSANIGRKAFPDLFTVSNCDILSPPVVFRHPDHGLMKTTTL